MKPFGVFCFSNFQMIHSNAIALQNLIHSNAIELKYKTLWLPYISTFDQISTNTVGLTVNTGLNIIIFPIYLATVQLQCDIYATITN